jgi:hypothetical protein
MEIVMINEVVLKGIVYIWSFAMALLIQLVWNRCMGLSHKPLNEVQEAADLVNLWVPKCNLGCQVVVEKDYHIRMHGFLHSWDCADSLPGFVNDGHGDELLKPEKLAPSELQAPLGDREVVARRIKSLVNGFARQPFCKESS